MNAQEQINLADLRAEYEKYDAPEVLALIDEVVSLREALRDETTRHHSLRWTLGLETHDGEEAQSEEQSVANLRALLAAGSRADTP